MTELVLAGSSQSLNVAAQRREGACRNGRKLVSRRDMRIGGAMRAFNISWSTPWAGMVPRGTGGDEELEVGRLLLVSSSLWENLKVRDPREGRFWASERGTVRRLVGSPILAALGVGGRCLRGKSELHSS